MLAKSLKSPADSIAYDLEDSVAVGKKGEARRLVCDFLEVGFCSMSFFRWESPGFRGISLMSRVVSAREGRLWFGSMLLVAGLRRMIWMILYVFTPFLSVSWNDLLRGILRST